MTKGDATVSFTEKLTPCSYRFFRSQSKIFQLTQFFKSWEITEAVAEERRLIPSSNRCSKIHHLTVHGLKRTSNFAISLMKSQLCTDGKEIDRKGSVIHIWELLFFPLNLFLFWRFRCRYRPSLVRSLIPNKGIPLFDSLFRLVIVSSCPEFIFRFCIYLGCFFFLPY